MMDSEEREAMIEDGYDPDGAPPPPELWLMPPDNDGERMWAQTRVTPWDVRYVPEAALVASELKVSDLFTLNELNKIALATERAARERAEEERDSLVAHCTRPDKIDGGLWVLTGWQDCGPQGMASTHAWFAIEAKAIERLRAAANLPAASGAEGGGG
jgi:hypothetical protein